MEKSIDLLDEGALRLALGPFVLRATLEYQRRDASGSVARPGLRADGGHGRAGGEFAPLPLHGGGGSCRAEAEGGIYASAGSGRTAAHGIIRALYGELREVPRYRLQTTEYAKAFLSAFRDLNWSPELGSFTNRRCQVPDKPELVPWRPVLEIGWTGGGCILYPLLLAQDLLGGLDAADPFTRLLLRQIRRMGRRWNPRSGLLLDLSRRWRGSQVNGWWAGYLVKDVHCAYTNGSAVFYLLESLDLLERRGIRTDSATEKNLMRVLDTVIDLQREDGCLGATFAVDERKVVDWDGFAGCWLAAALAQGYLHSRRAEYLACAERALGYYHRSVKELACHGTPMDTMKAVDEEGNLAFIRAARLLHEITAKDRYLEMLQDGCDYECLWKYAFRARPEFPPLLGSSWSSCGGSVTSVSNPHIHPMGVTVADDLRYLHGVTGDEYHGRRAEDTLAWAKSSADLYPEVSGYGRLGVLTERFCPSDGLLLERFGPRSNPFSLDCLAGGAAVPTTPVVPRASTESSGAKEEQGSPASIWFSYHAWAAAAVLEGLCHALAPFLIPLPW